jgi:hypothetical protein
MAHKEIQYLPKETSEIKNGILYIYRDHKKLVPKPVIVYSEQEKTEMLRNAFNNFDKKYDPKAILNFKPTKIIDINTPLDDFLKSSFQS